MRLFYDIEKDQHLHQKTLILYALFSEINLANGFKFHSLLIATIAIWGALILQINSARI